MAPEYAGRGDAARSMELLWGRAQRGTRGPKQGTDLDAIVGAAIDLADADGLAAVSMRRVAERLGIGTMSLYTYVPGKAELLDLMLETVYAERQDDHPEPGATVRVQLEALARGQWAFHQRHPWTLQIATGRSVLGPNETQGYESALSVVADLGLAARDAVAIIDTISLYVRGAARDAAEAAGAEQATGMTELEWWTERDEILTEKMADGRFPTLERLGAAGGFDVPEGTENYNVQFIVDDFEFGLQRMLDGIESYVAAHGGPKQRRARSRPR
jgi:AcrR family transcriptional regulator